MSSEIVSDIGSENRRLKFENGLITEFPDICFNWIYQYRERIDQISNEPFLPLYLWMFHNRPTRKRRLKLSRLIDFNVALLMQL